jgi:adenylate kinase
MDSGALVPDEMIVEVILARVLSSNGRAGVLLDGFPRTLPQAQQLDEALSGAGSRVDLVLSIVVPDEPIIDRITGRRLCPACDRVYHVKHMPPRRDGICDVDGQKLIQRRDDTAEVVKQRLAAYHEQTEPLEAYYCQKGILTEVDGTRDIDTVAACVSEIVRGRLNEAGS